MESLAKIVALYLRVIGWFFVASFALMFCMGVWAVFQPSSSERLKAQIHKEDSPTWYLRQ